MKQQYRRAMEALYLACVGLAGVALVVITLVIPAGVFMRYVANSPLSWPEPASVVLMVMFSFVGAAAIYRANGHIAVEALANAVPEGVRRAMRWGVHACMAAMAVFMVVYGGQLCLLTRNNTMAEFPALSVGVVYLPIPVSGLIMALFIVEKLWAGEPPADSVMYRDEPAGVE